MLPKFSIILPTYNCKFFERAFNSVLNQSYQNWELLIIDNNSDNKVLDILKKNKNKKVKYFKTNNFGIIGKSRNLGIKKSNYDWVAFLDSDDCWYKEKLQTIVNILKKKKYHFFFHNMYVVDDRVTFIKKKLYSYKKKISKKKKFDDLILNGNNIIQSSVVVKKKLLMKVKKVSEKKELVTWEDFDLWLKIFKITNNFCLIDICLGEYYVTKKDKKLKRFVENIKQFKKKYSSDINKIKKKYKITTIPWINYAEGLYYYKTGRYFSAKKKFDLIGVRYNQFYFNMIFIKFKIFMQVFFK